MLYQRIWTEESFEEMEWHDCYIHGIGFELENYKILFDLDYILEWYDPIENSKFFSFDIAPATVVFQNIHQLAIDIEPIEEIQIDRLYRQEERKPRNANYVKKDIEWKWIIECQEGEISFYSIGFNLYLRKEPQKLEKQCFSLEERGGISFEIPKELLTLT